MTVTWDYDGAGTLLVHLSTSVLGHTYEAFTGDFNGGDGTAVGTGGAITINVTGIGGNTPGDQFYATVRCDADLSYFAVNVFKYGTPSTTGVGLPATWAYDGSTGVSVDFDTASADDYALRVSWYDTGTEGGFAFATGPGSPLTMAISLSSTPAAGSILVAWIVDNDSPNTSTVAARVFVEGVAGAGSAGDPGTGGTETGTSAGGGGGADVVPPNLKLIGAYRSKVTLVYDEALDPATPDVSEFAVEVNGVSNTVTGLSVAGSTVTLALTTPVAAGDRVKVSYTG